MLDLSISCPSLQTLLDVPFQTNPFGSSEKLITKGNNKTESFWKIEPQFNLLQWTSLLFLYSFAGNVNHLKKKLSHLTETKSVILFYLLFPIVVAFLATRDHIATHFVIFFKSAKIKSVKIRSLTAKSDVLSNKVRSHKLRESLCETDREKNWCKTK